MESVALSTDELRSWLSFAYIRSSRTEAAECFHGVVRSDCAYANRHLKDSFRKRPWWKTYESTEDFESTHKYLPQSMVPRLCLMIDEYESVDWESVLQPPNVVTNNFCVRKGLSRKANFAKQMQRYIDRNPKTCLARAIPPTACIDTVPVFINRSRMVDFRSAMVECLIEASELMEEHPGKRWILKPSLANKGAEVFIVDTIEEVESKLKEWRDVGQWVLQEYMDKPLLLDGRKFHLRVYVMANSALQVFVFQEALVLTAVDKYDRDTANIHAHITNTCVNVERADFDEAKYVRCVSELPSMLEKEGMSAEEGSNHVQKLWKDINEAVSQVFTAFEGCFALYMPLPNAYELYGVDFLVSEDWQVHLLEFNPTPDIKQTGSRLDYIIAAMLEGSIALGVDSRFPPPADVAVERAKCDVSPHLRWQCVYDKAWRSSKEPINVKFA